MPPEDDHLYFLEESLGSPKILAALTEGGARVTTLVEHFRRGEDDPVWLRAAGTNDWVVISKDKKIRYSPLSLKTISRYRVRLFLLSQGNASGDEIARTILEALPSIRKFLRKYSGPFIVKVYRNSVLKPVYPVELVRTRRNARQNPS